MAYIVMLDSSNIIDEKESDKFIQKLDKDPKVKDPEALGAWIGRKLYGKEKMDKFASVARDRAPKKLKKRK